MAEVESFRGWYETLDGLRYLLPEEDARDKFAGESWGVRLSKQSERQLEVGAGLGGSRCAESRIVAARWRSDTVNV